MRWCVEKGVIVIGGQTETDKNSKAMFEFHAVFSAFFSFD